MTEGRQAAYVERVAARRVCMRLTDGDARRSREEERGASMAVEDMATMNK